MFPMAAMGGLFYAGFKVYLHEVAVLVCLGPLIMAIAHQQVRLDLPGTTVHKGSSLFS